ncbi:cysteine-rich CWC family protein [Paenibacillus protaetiae]|uniref:Cysteine-rich CWC family protein n=1 Tax=Paenibacillus protaetiae TaxID=2509456 RepID=A0A4P6EUG5_9BACL|nr:cysteine-rich CWC family protein [Paenibacillus protaetiae]QAY65753.1 hypothetical protein ET464_04530 [Paenibacillus protaetiae]
MNCPFCGKSGYCGNLNSHPDVPCWCYKAVFPKDVLALIPKELQGKACICPDCLRTLTLSLHPPHD